MITQTLWCSTPDAVVRLVAAKTDEERFAVCSMTINGLNMTEHNWVKVGVAMIHPAFVPPDTMYSKALLTADAKIEKLTQEFLVAKAEIEEFKATLLALPAPAQTAATVEVFVEGVVDDIPF